MIGKAKVHPIPADAATIRRYERFVAEVDQLRPDQLVDLASRFAVAEDVDGYGAAAEIAADMAYANGRVEERVDAAGADADEVAGASKPAREIVRLGLIAGGGCLDIAYAILTRDLLTADQYRLLTGWASAVIPGIDADDPDEPAPVSPAGPPAAAPVLLELDDEPEPTPLPRRDPAGNGAGPVPPDRIPDPVRADRDRLTPAPAPPVNLDDLFVPEFVPGAAKPGARRPAEVVTAAPASRQRTDLYRRYWRARAIRTASFVVAGILFMGGPVALGGGAVALAQAACLATVIALAVGLVFEIQVRRLRHRWAPPRRAARRGDDQPNTTTTPTRKVSR